MCGAFPRLFLTIISSVFSISLLLSRKGEWGKPLFGIQREVSPTNFLQILRNGFQQRAGGVAAVFPIHEAQEAFFFDVGAFLGDGFRVVEGDEGAAVKERRGLGGVVPIPDEAVFADIIF